MSSSRESKTTSPVALWDRPKRRWIDKAVIALGVALAVLFIGSCALMLKWWILAALVPCALMLIGEEVIMSWLFFVSVAGGVVWLFFKYALGIEL